ncbi:hypothetical protein [Pontibacter sp. G13]|uniref:hypothetical protein n=1 Tax=Pontibacter sp. G13 TaxID=3074898 RepID=UPI0028897F5B|nr:hypothetical protein [Pontibacter sp. G13]WNJ20527.1 hypothetical protein RJD25_08595 [Pontibacter sp. G13]
MSVRISSLLTLLGLVFTASVFAQSTLLDPFPAEQLGAANISATPQGSVWDLFRNPAGVGNMDSPEIGINYLLPFGEPTLSQFSVAGLMPMGSQQTLGIIGTWTGVEDFRTWGLGGNYSIELGDSWWIGAQLVLYDLNISGLGGDWVGSGNAGLQWQAMEKIRLGAFLMRVTSPTWGTEFDAEPLPTRSGIGITLSPSPQIDVSLEWEATQAQHHVRVSSQIELSEWVMIQGGIQTDPLSLHVGMGVSLSKIRWNLAGQYFQELGLTSATSLTHSW